MGRVGEDGFVWADEVLEQGQEGVEDEADGRRADLDERGAGDGDDVVLGEVLGRRAGAVGELSTAPSASTSIDPFHRLIASYTTQPFKLIPGRSERSKRESTHSRGQPVHQAGHQARIAVHCALTRAEPGRRLLMVELGVLFSVLFLFLS
jgi:hypothetical protein